MDSSNGAPYEEKTKRTRKAKSEQFTADDATEQVAPVIGALSAQIHLEVTALLDSAATALGGERSDVIREAVRYFIRSHFTPETGWVFPDEVLDDMPFCAKPQYSNRKLYR